MLRGYLKSIVVAALASIITLMLTSSQATARLSNLTQTIMTSVRPTSSTVGEHLAGSAQSWHGQVTPDGQFKPEKDRYHLYIGLFCPFAHRANLVRHLYGLEEIIPISIVKPYPKGDENGWPGWQFPSTDSDYPNATVDHLFGSSYLHEVYFKADPQYKGRYSVPVLWDEKTNTIVNNESAELLRWLPHAFDSITGGRKDLELYPEELRATIDQVTEWMQRDLNSGVYKAGFATIQEDYDKNVIPVFAALNKLEKVIANNGGPFILGKKMTELDIRAYATVVRFDTVVSIPQTGVFRIFFCLHHFWSFRYRSSGADRL